MKRLIPGALFALSVIAMLAIAAPSNAVCETDADPPLGRQVFDAQ